MALNIKKVRPLFTGVITTANKYVGEVTAPGGLLLDVSKMDGTLNVYQTVIAVGRNVMDVKPGEIVRLNYKRYAKAKHIPGAIEDNIQSDNLQVVYEIPMVRIEGKDCLFVQNNDIEYVVEEYDGVDDGGLLQ